MGNPYAVSDFQNMVKSIEALRVDPRQTALDVEKNQAWKERMEGTYAQKLNDERVKALQTHENAKDLADFNNRLAGKSMAEKYGYDWNLAEQKNIADRMREMAIQSMRGAQEEAVQGLRNQGSLATQGLQNEGYTKANNASIMGKLYGDLYTHHLTSDSGLGTHEDKLKRVHAATMDSMRVFGKILGLSGSNGQGLPPPPPGQDSSGAPGAALPPPPSSPLSPSASLSPTADSERVAREARIKDDAIRARSPGYKWYQYLSPTLMPYTKQETEALRRQGIDPNNRTNFDPSRPIY